MKIQYLKKSKLPDTPGVYTFRDYRKRPLYIGRATSLKDRVKSYFGIDLIETRGPRIVDMITKAQTVTWQETGSVLEAILLEGVLIKRYRPFYNVDEMDDKSSQYVVITNEEWPRVFLARARDLEQARNNRELPYKIKELFGPYTESALIKDSLKILRRLFPFRDKKAHDPRYEAFYRAIGRSPVIGGDTSYRRTIRHLTLFFEGKSNEVRKLIERDMERHAKNMQFEEAVQDRKLLNALKHINDIALIKADRTGMSDIPGDNEFRIEAYDISHLSGTNVVGAMVASINGQLSPAEYRKFKISKQTNDDIAGLQEILGRRLNHTEWTYPDLIVVDGNEVQFSHIEIVLKSRRISIPVVAVTKDKQHKASRLLGNVEMIKRYKKNIIALNAEAHRFVIAFHRKRRALRPPQLSPSTP